jgi:exonuclease III
MKILFWNIRGMGKKARIRQLKELIAGERLDCVGLQETIKQQFTDAELESLAPGKGFRWNWVPFKGHSGGSCWV